MSSDGNTEEVFDEEELADGFDEETIARKTSRMSTSTSTSKTSRTSKASIRRTSWMLTTLRKWKMRTSCPKLSSSKTTTWLTTDIELALDEVLAETIRRTSTPEDDEEAPGEVDTSSIRPRPFCPNRMMSSAAPRADC